MSKTKRQFIGSELGAERQKNKKNKKNQKKPKKLLTKICLECIINMLSGQPKYFRRFLYDSCPH